MISIFSILILLSTINFSQKKEFIQTTFSSKKSDFSVLILTETQGFVHYDAIREGTKLITKLGSENNTFLACFISFIKLTLLKSKGSPRIVSY